jgi:hypothetical protein
VKQSGRQAPGDGGGIGEPIQADGIGDSPLRPEERETYRTEPNPEEERMPEPETAAAVRESRPWIAVGIVLLVIFLAILAWAVVVPFFL